MSLTAARHGPGWVALALVCLACGRGVGETETAPAPADDEQDHPTAPQVDPVPIEPAHQAFLSGWMPLDPTGVPQFAGRYPKYDGRGVIIAILDSGLDTDVAGFRATSTGGTKVLDLRDFSGEGLVPLDPVTPVGDVVTIVSRSLTGFGRVVGHSVSQEYFAGYIAEIPLGTPLVVDPEEPQASDLNGNGNYADTLPVVVTRAQNGWVLFADTDGDGSLSNERPVYDYLVARQTFGWVTDPDGHSPLAVTANFSDSAGRPVLDLMFDTSGHGTHVAGIAAGHDMYGVDGFDGVAPGALLLGLKISDDSRGGISVDGSIAGAMAYAVAFAERRRMPLVINLSFGVGNERERSAVIDRLVDSLLARHPDVVMTVSAGNDGPGLSTVGFPGSAMRPITVGATFPLVFLARPVNGPPLEDPLAFFSSRGGELAKPDVVAPGVAYSTVPRWDTGNERNAGTSMAAPHVAGLAARLLSAALDQGLHPSGATVKRALMVTAVPLAGNDFVDQGTGIPDLASAWHWLEQRGSTEAGSVGSTTAEWTIVEPHSSSGSHDDEGDAVAPGSARTELSTVWPADRSAGPLSRAVRTVVDPLPPGQSITRGPKRLDAGATERLFFLAEPGRPFQVRVETGGAFDRMFTSLHEPGGAPYRGDNGLPAGPGDDGAVYQVDAGDVVAGVYQMAVAASPVAAGKVTIQLIQSPFSLAARSSGSEVRLTVANESAAPATARARAALIGGVRRDTVRGAGGEERRLAFTIPAWARFMELDVSLEPDDWGHFTDYGVTVFDSVGRVVADGPLDYAHGRLSEVLSQAHAGLPVELSLLPGLADTTDSAPWTAEVAVRFYAGSAVPLELSPGGSGELSLQPGQMADAVFAVRSSPWPLAEDFVPLGLMITETEGPTWTGQVALPPAETQ